VGTSGGTAEGTELGTMWGLGVDLDARAGADVTAL